MLQILQVKEPVSGGEPETVDQVLAHADRMLVEGKYAQAAATLEKGLSGTYPPPLSPPPSPPHYPTSNEQSTWNACEIRPKSVRRLRKAVWYASTDPKE